MSFRITTKNSVYVISQEGSKRTLRKWKNGQGEVIFDDVLDWAISDPKVYGGEPRLVVTGKRGTHPHQPGTLITSKVVDQFEVLTRVDGFKAAIRSNPDAVIDPSFDLFAASVGQLRLLGPTAEPGLRLP